MNKSEKSITSGPLLSKQLFFSKYCSGTPITTKKGLGMQYNTTLELQSRDIEVAAFDFDEKMNELFLNV